ncbi:hypothetical protein [Halanaerobium hydrogeniformans]|uniref:Uncharacterized protein n=1 Tax=Halanaerobium hydrogeniformans TaxID=656519 RepID=E4RMY4_HALHG|nr:hypothetical protein [Halanaerobium hydrogeniformans]ADQ14201.1 hypothetical protein Halsa_0752 [Halanaerobium hydrogeniformans]
MEKNIKNLIQELDGVVSCTLTGGNEVDEIHIIADQKRDPKRIVRDVETVFLVHNDQKIDHKKISIARIRSDFSQDIEKMASNRVELISVYTENNRSRCMVIMEINEERIEESFEAQVGESIEKLIARSVIEVLNRYFKIEGRLIVEDVFTVKGKEDLVIAQVSKFESQRNRLAEKLVGAVYLDNNMALAIAKACLKAVNRQLTA